MQYFALSRKMFYIQTQDFNEIRVMCQGTVGQAAFVHVRIAAKSLFKSSCSSVRPHVTTAEWIVIKLELKKF
jgi:hypothetical protein